MWLWSNKSIYNKPTTKILPGTLEEAENLFDKNVMSIKTLFKEIGNIKEIIHKEQKKNYMMIVTLLLIRFLLKLMKKFHVLE